jgi:hypothetical protein
MGSTASKRRKVSRHIAMPPRPVEETIETRRDRRRLFRAFAKLFARRIHDEETFFRLEFRQYDCPRPYTSARDAQLGIEQLGPPPLGL